MIYVAQPGLPVGENRRRAILAHHEASGQPAIPDPDTGDLLFATGAIFLRGGSEIPVEPTPRPKGNNADDYRSYQKTLRNRIRYWQLRLAPAEREFANRKNRA